MMRISASVVLAFVLATAPADAKRFRMANIKFQKEGQKVVALDHDGKTQMLLGVSSHVSGPACEKISCANPTCPPGFQATTVDGHCCPYCINPDLTIAPEITGATGSNGGSKSAFCENVWCFPTMCKGEEKMPRQDNGMCCPKCQ
eukprot:TRINITY_DN423_c0_g1_i1.p1 TRINITY_DN423_c0_g1~~TRINITY_DN423_c0_g1_i1.p1  ORF type:complete len:145 (-),score=39.90 TRINITY_DN423_c0_g1_i1:181-615(-)